MTEESPFNGENDIKMQIATKDKEYKIFDWIREYLQDLLCGLLDKDPTKVKAPKWFVF